MRRANKTCKHNIIVKVYMTERIFSFIVSMVCCVAYTCKTMSNQWTCMFEFPEDYKRCKLWSTRVKGGISFHRRALGCVQSTFQMKVSGQSLICRFHWVENKEISCKA
jgi:hypothetical protein